MLISVLLVSACSSPKYTYNFDTYDYNSGRKKKEAEKEVVASQTEAPSIQALPSPLTVSEENVVASSSPVTPAPASTLKPAKKYGDLTKTEKKELRKAVKTEIKNYLKAKKGDGNVSQESKAMDYNLKMAIIFGAVALTLSFFGGVNSIFWILSVVSLVIGVVFFIKWIAEQ